MSANKEAESLFARFWEWRLSESPEFATLIGNYKYDDRLESYAFDSFDKRIKASKLFLADAVQILSDDNLDENTRLNLSLLVAELNTYLKGMEVKGYLFPITYLDGILVDLKLLIESMVYETPHDYEKLISRLRALPQHITEIIEVMREGIKLNMTTHQVSMRGVLQQLDFLQVEADKSPLFEPFLKIPSNFEASESMKLKNEAENVINHEVLPSFLRLREFLESEYFKHLRPNVSISSLPNGEEFYSKCLYFHLGFSITPEEVHDLGLKEVKRIKEEIESVVEKLELDMSVEEFESRMQKDNDFYFETPEELLEAYNGLVFNKIRPKLSAVINPLPQMELVIKPSTAAMINGPSAYYLGGTPDGRRPGVFYVNTGHLASCPKYEMMTLALHEVEPGHHLQMSYMMQMKNVPEFRLFIEDRKYSSSPSRFPLHTAFLEGWGLYSEYLGNELKMYEDPYFEYGHLCYQIFRACRLVVDTGIHAFGWTPEQALEYMMENTALPKKELENEINRYITWPGQACAYKMGEMKIKQLRKKAESSLGNKFDVREFHDVVLRSAGPLNWLEKNVDAYIYEQKYTFK